MRHIIREFMQGWREGQRIREPEMLKITTDIPVHYHELRDGEERHAHASPLGDTPHEHDPHLGGRWLGVQPRHMRTRSPEFAEPITDGRRYWRDRALKAEAELLRATTRKQRVWDPDGCCGPDDWAHSRCTDDCPPHGLLEPHQ